MTGRWNDPSAFRADPAATPTAQPSRRQTLALLAVVAVVAASVAVASYVVRPERARAFDLFHGSLFLSDQKSPVAVDLASGKPTLRLLGAAKQVGVAGEQTLGVVPLDDRTLLLNGSTGEFNMVDNGGFVVKHDGGGVPLAARTGATSAFGVAAGNGQAYIVRTGAQGGTDVYLVSQPTVEAALSATRNIRPRASTSMPAPVSTEAGGSASANGDLWLLVGAGPIRTIQRLQVPAGSSAGAALDISDQGTIGRPAAIGVAGASTGQTEAAVVGVASPNRIQLFGSGADPRTVAFAPIAGVDAILPTSGSAGRLTFLLHAADGWHIVSVRPDGSDLRRPRLLPDVPADALLAEPAASNGYLYTIDQRDGSIVRIGLDGSSASVPGAASYPLSRVGGRVVEPKAFGDTYVVARGSRVVFNSAVHADALMLFTDGSRPPVRIAKNAAVTVNAAAGAEALTRSTVNPNQEPGRLPRPGQPKPKPQQAAPINNRIDCKTATQRPHIPVITSAVPGSRTVALSWSYPVLDTQDCYPSTYEVRVKALGNSGAPQPPESVRIDAQTGTNLGGLYPSTQYEITVVAYINALATASAPLRITTGGEGPAAPTGLRVTAGDGGDWTLTWDSCGSAEGGCVTAQSWTVVPSFCDGRGLSTPPASISVTADPTSQAQPPAVYQGSDELLGRGLQFEVQGTGDRGQVGTPSAESDCVYSWATPVAADLSVQASSPAPTSSSTDTTTTTATVTFAHGQVEGLGGVGGTLTYQLLSGGTLIDKRGPTTDSSVSLSGIRAGRHYEVKVLASPPRHPEILVEVGPVDVVPAIAAWPAVTVPPPTFDSPPGLTGALHVTFHFPAGTDTNGETFELTDSQLVCGNTSLPLERSDVAPGDELVFSGISRVTYNGSCTVSIKLAQDPRTTTDPPLYGAGFSAAATSDPFSIPLPSLNSTAGDFAAQWGGSNGQPTIVLTYHGDDELSGATNWAISVSNGSADCGDTTDAPPATVHVDKACIKAGGTFTVSVDYTYFGIAHAHFDVIVGGDAPTPVDPAKISFAATWNSNARLPQVDLTYTGTEDPASLAPLQWTETVTSSASPGVVCGADTDDPAGSTARIDVDLTACPPTVDAATATYNVKVSFTDPNYGQSGDYTYVVEGTPPT